MGGEKIENGDDINGLSTNNGIGAIIAGGVFVDGRTNVKPTKIVQNTWTQSWQANEQFFNL